MAPSDLPAVWRYCKAQNRRDGTSYGVPHVFDEQGRLLPNIALALVTLDGKGRVRGAHIFERTLEMMSFGGGAAATAMSMAEAPAVFYELRALGYQDLHIQVPKSHVSELETDLKDKMGMTRDDEALAHFYREL